MTSSVDAGSPRILHLEDDPVAIQLVAAQLAQAGITNAVVGVSDRDAFMRELRTGSVDVILSDFNVPGFAGLDALAEVRSTAGHVPFVFVCGVSGRERVTPCLEAGAEDFVGKDQLWRLPLVVRRLLVTVIETRRRLALEKQQRSMACLVQAVSQLSLCRTLSEIAAVVRTAAREINGADGATFVLRDGDKCYYFDENAISPLWKGLRFPLEACISGWAMLNKQAVAIEDIYQDPRIPADAYRPTFVKSLVMVPVRQAAPVASIGNYWAHQHKATADEIALIQALADATSVSMENVAVYSDLENRVRERTSALEAANRDLEAFSYSVSHDLRSPLSQLMGFTELLKEHFSSDLPSTQLHFLSHIQDAGERMNELIDDLLKLSRVARSDLNRTSIDIARIANDTRAVLATRAPGRKIEWQIDEGLDASGDHSLVSVVIENLLSNAFKYSSKRTDARIEVGVVDRGPGDKTRSFYVRDNGAGFDPERADRLFTPFGRLHAQSDFPGTGVGLATCQRIIHRHGGQLWAESKPGDGATFYFTLPAA